MLHAALLRLKTNAYMNNNNQKKKKERNSQQALTRNKQSILHKRFK